MEKTKKIFGENKKNILSQSNYKTNHNLIISKQRKTQKQKSMPRDLEFRFLIILGYFLFRDDRQMRNDFSLEKSDKIDIADYVNNKNIDIVIKALCLYAHYIDFYHVHFCCENPREECENMMRFLSFQHNWFYAQMKMPTTIISFLRQKFHYENVDAIPNEEGDFDEFDRNEVYSYTFHNKNTLLEFNQKFDVQTEEEAQDNEESRLKMISQFESFFRCDGHSFEKAFHQDCINYLIKQE